MDHRRMDMGAMGADDGQSKVVQEARKLMQDEEENAGNVKADTEDAGQGIRMGKLGRKKKKRGAQVGKPGEAQKEGAYTQKLGGLSRPTDMLEMRGQEGFKEEDIEFMRKAIQVLCQSTNPLGKSIDFVTDDVESMANEFKLWRQEAINCNS